MLSKIKKRRRKINYPPPPPVPTVKKNFDLCRMTELCTGNDYSAFREYAEEFFDEDELQDAWESGQKGRG